MLCFAGNTDFEVFAESIEVLDDSRYAIAPPSVHPQTGLAYEWADSGDYSFDAVLLIQASWIAGAQYVSPGSDLDS